MANSSGWNKDLPDGNTYVRQADDIIRSDKSILEATLSAGHLFGSAETLYAGEHKEGSARAYVTTAASLPAPIAAIARGRLALTSDSKALYAYLTSSSSPTKIFDPADYYTKSAANTAFQPAGSYATAGHTHDSRYYTESESDARFQPLGSYAPAVHNHNSLYYTETESDSRFAPASHTHDSRYYTETESDAKYQLKGNYATVLAGSAEIAATGVAANFNASFNVLIPGVDAGDVAMAAVSLPIRTAIRCDCYSGGVTVFVENLSSSAFTIPAQTIKVVVFD